MEIREALQELDAFNDDHWTADGAPKIDAVKELIGGPVLRQNIIDAAPDFSRDNQVIPDAEPAKDESNEPPVHEPEEYLSKLEQFVEAGPMTPRDFAEFLKTYPTEGLADLQAVMITQREAVQEAVKTAAEMTGRVKIGLNWVNSRIKIEIPDMNNQQAIQHFIKSQQQTRAAKVEATREILKGVKLSDLDPRAAIDRAMARKNARGTGRPTRPNMS